MIEDIVRSEIRRVTGSGENERPKYNIGKVSGFVTKKSPWKKFTDTFFEEDLETVKKSLVREVIVPTIKGFLADIFIGGIERTLYGSSGRGVNNGGRTFSNSLVRTITTSQHDYTSHSKGAAVIDETERKFTFKDVVMSNRSSAQHLLDTLRQAIIDHHSVSVAELYDALDATDEAGMDYTDNYWGWTNLDNVQIKRVSNGYWLDLPKPVSLK